MPSDKVFDFGPSLLDEMDLMFRSMSASGDSASLNPPLTPNFDNVNKRNELTEKLSRKGQSAGATSGASGMSGGEIRFYARFSPIQLHEFFILLKQSPLIRTRKSQRR